MTTVSGYVPYNSLYADNERIATLGIFNTGKPVGEVMLSLMLNPNGLDEVLIEDEKSGDVYVCYGKGLDIDELSVGSPVEVSGRQGTVLMNLNETNEFWEGVGDSVEGAYVAGARAVVAVFGYGLNAVAGMSAGVGSGGAVAGMSVGTAGSIGFGSLLGGGVVALGGIGYLGWSGYSATNADQNESIYKSLAQGSISK